MRFLALFLTLAALATVQAQLPPYQRNPFTTNTAASVDQFVVLFQGGFTLTNEMGTLVGIYDGDLNQTITLDGSTGKGTFTNLAFKVPQWVDIPLIYGYSILGPNAPSLTVTTNGGPIQQLAMDNGDIIYASGHFPHNTAGTNAAFPVFAIRPHVHWTPIGTLDATHSNVTWRAEWEIASINGLWSFRGTNTATVGVTNNFTLRRTDIGTITFAIPPGHDAGIRLRLMRPASVAQEYGNDHIVLFDGIEVNVPVGNENLLGHTN